MDWSTRYDNAGCCCKTRMCCGGGTVLTKTFPEYSIIAGNPGRVVKRRNEFT